MGLLDGILQQLSAIREIGNTNLKNIRSAPNNEYAADEDDDFIDSGEESEDLESPENIAITRRALARSAAQQAITVQSFFSEEELEEFKKLIQLEIENNDSGQSRASLENLVKKASSLFAAYGGRSFVNSTFKRALLRQANGDAELQKFESYVAQALGKERLSRIIYNIDEIGADEFFLRYDSNEDDGEFSPDEDGEIVAQAERKNVRRARLQKAENMLPSNWWSLDRSQQLAWLLKYTNKDPVVFNGYVSRKIMKVPKSDKSSLLQELRDFQNAREEAYRQLVKSSKQKVKERDREAGGFLPENAVVRFRMGMIWTREGEGKLEVLSMGHKTNNPREVILEYTPESEDGTVLCIAELDDSMESFATFPYDKHIAQFLRIEQAPVITGASEGTSTLLFADDPKFETQSRFIPNMKYFCPQWEEGKIREFQWFLCKKLEDDDDYVVFEDLLTKEEVASARQSEIVTADIRTREDVRLNDSVDVEYVKLDGDDDSERARLIYATYTKRQYKIIQEELQTQARADAQNAAARRRNGQRRLGTLNTDIVDDDDYDPDFIEPTENPRSRPTLIAAITPESNVELPNLATELVEDKVLEMGHLQRAAYFKSRRKTSKKPLCRFRVGEVLKGKKCKGKVTCLMTITKRGRKADENDNSEYFNVDVTGEGGVLKGKYQYKIRMHAKEPYAYHRNNVDFAFEVATVTFGNNSLTPKTVSAWKQSCPHGFENGVEYYSNIDGGILFKCNAKVDDKLMSIVDQRWVEERDGREPLPVETSKIVVRTDTDKFKPYEEQLQSHPGEKFADSPICIEEYEQTVVSQRTDTRRSSGTRNSRRATRANKGKFTNEEVQQYKDLVQKEGSSEFTDEDDTQLALMRQRAARLLGYNLFVLQNGFESNLMRERDEMEAEDWIDLNGDLARLGAEPQQSDKDTSSGTSDYNDNDYLRDTPVTLRRQDPEEIEEVDDDRVNYILGQGADY